MNTQNITRDPLDFSDIEGDLNEGGASHPKSRAGGVEWSNPCPKCRGTGHFTGYSGRVVGECFMCKGKGLLTFRTPPEHRAKAKAQRTDRKAQLAAAAVATFENARPAEWAWMLKSASSFDFAKSMVETVTKFGDLTEKQLAAVQRCVERDAQKTVARQATTALAREIDVSRIQTLFDTARGHQLKRPKLRVGEIELSLASSTGRNPGAVYVKRGDTYLGKIIEGIYSPSFAATASDLDTVKATAADPMSLAVAYGRRTGNCACCGRLLTDPVSVARGIGPICIETWGM